MEPAYDTVEYWRGLYFRSDDERHNMVMRMFELERKLEQVDIRVHCAWRHGKAYYEENAKLRKQLFDVAYKLSCASERIRILEDK